MLPIVWGFNRFWMARQRRRCRSGSGRSWCTSCCWCSTGCSGPMAVESARRADGAAGETTSTTATAPRLQLHSVPVPDPGARRLSVHRGGSGVGWVSTAGSSWAAKIGPALGRHDGRRRHQHRARDGPQEGVHRAPAGQDRPRAHLLRPLLHRAQPRPPCPGRHPGGSGVRAVSGETFWSSQGAAWGSLKSSGTGG